MGIINERMVSQCLMHHVKCPVYPERAQEEHCPLRIHWAGASCVPWSRLGSRAKISHAASVPYSVFMAEQDQAGSDFSFLEEADTFPIDEMWTERMKAKGYHVVTARLAPYHVGFPIGGARCFSCAVNTATQVWLGPQSSEQILEDFMRRFGCQVILIILILLLNAR